MWIEDPDGTRIVVEVPAGYPLRRDPRKRRLNLPASKLMVALINAALV
jgi:hypothetical protein